MKGWLGVLIGSALAAQTPIDVKELAEFRLTSPVFERFVEASRRVVEVVRQDAALTDAPLFTSEVTRSGDAAMAANELVSRLQAHRGLAAALAAAKIAPRDYAKFAITLAAARDAHGFLQSGVLQRVPDGAPSSNVEFVRRRESEVFAVLALLGIRH